MKYKFKFLRDRFACRVPVGKNKFVDVDVTNGFYQTDDKEVADYLESRSKEHGSLIISLNAVGAVIEVPQSRIQVVGGARSSKDSEGETR